MSLKNFHKSLPDAQIRVQLFLERTGLTNGLASVNRLTGEASTRSYFRVIAPDRAPLILAVYEGPIDCLTLPFTNVASLLGRMQIPVPQILGCEADLGIVIIEDLGDTTLQKHLTTIPNENHIILYKKAVSFIEVIQRRGQQLTSPKYIPYDLVFDVEKLTWELDFFVEQFLKSHCCLNITLATKGTLQNEFNNLAEELAVEPHVLCHRDYHSRNLMMHNNQLFLIDFQDARMGPTTYDLASLLRDSYVELNEQLIEELISYFLKITNSAIPQHSFRKKFDLMCLQRNLKALGTFGYQVTKCKNSSYLQHIPRTLNYIHQNLQKYPQLDQLHNLLADCLPELR